VRKTLAALRIAPSRYYRWLKEERRAKSLPCEPCRPVSPFEALPEVKAAVIAYAKKHPELRHRELACRMVDEDVAHFSASTLYRILREADPECPWRRLTNRVRAAKEKATRPDQRRSTDLLHIRVGEGAYFVISFLDEYTRYFVHHEELLGTDSVSVSLAAQKAIETLPKCQDGKSLVTQEIRTANGSAYISKDFRVVLNTNGLGHD
jgi:hypothetical protein